MAKEGFAGEVMRDATPIRRQRVDARRPPRRVLLLLVMAVGLLGGGSCFRLVDENGTEPFIPYEQGFVGRYNRVSNINGGCDIRVLQGVSEAFYSNKFEPLSRRTFVGLI